MSCLSLFVYQAINNLELLFFCQGKLKEGPQALEAAPQAAKSMPRAVVGVDAGGGAVRTARQ